PCSSCSSCSAGRGESGERSLRRRLGHRLPDDRHPREERLVRLGQSLLLRDRRRVPLERARRGAGARARRGAERAVHVTSKLCSGPAPPEPTRLPIDRQHWNFHQSGRYQGKPVARCKACQNWAKLVHKDGPHGLTAAATVLPYLKELLE